MHHGGVPSGGLNVGQTVVVQEIVVRDLMSVQVVKRVRNLSVNMREAKFVVAIVAKETHQCVV